MPDQDQPGTGADKTKPPKLPAKTPKAVTDFVECSAVTLVLKGGKPDWLPPIKIPKTDIELPTPSVTFAGGPNADSVDVSLDLGLKTVTIRMTVVDGKLSVDTSGFLDDIGAAADTDAWVKAFNDNLAGHHFKLDRPKLAKGEVTLGKAAVAAAPKATTPTPPSSTDTPKVKAGAAAGPVPTTLPFDTGLPVGLTPTPTFVVGSPPTMPEGAPAAARDFFECRTNSFEITRGPAEWLPPHGIGPPPTITGFSYEGFDLGGPDGSPAPYPSFRMTDPVPAPGGQTCGLLAVQNAEDRPDLLQWVDQLNQFLVANNKRLEFVSYMPADESGMPGPPRLRLEKVDIPPTPVAVGPDGAVSTIAVGPEDVLSVVGFWTKKKMAVAGGVVAVVVLIGGGLVALDSSKSGKTSAAGGSKTEQPKTEPPAKTGSGGQTNTPTPQANLDGSAANFDTTKAVKLDQDTTWMRTGLPGYMPGALSGFSSANTRFGATDAQQAAAALGYLGGNKVVDALPGADPQNPGASPDKVGTITFYFDAFGAGNAQKAIDTIYLNTDALGPVNTLKVLTGGHTIYEWNPLSAPTKTLIFGYSVYGPDALTLSGFGVGMTQQDKLTIANELGAALQAADHQAGKTSGR